MPKVSVVVPIYNTEKYLSECLDSLLNQTLKDIEIICVNDGSTDNSGKILDEYREKNDRIKVINKENSGYGHSVNLGFDNATADYVGIIEPDDITKPEMFEDLYNLITEGGCDFVKSNFYLYYSKKGRLEKNKNFKYRYLNVVTNLDEDMTMLAVHPSVWSAVYRKDFLDKNNIRFLETPGASYQDISFHHKVMLMAKKFIFTDKAYVYYRQDNENSSVKNKSKIYYVADEFNETQKFIDLHQEFKKYEEYLKVIQFNTYMWNLDRLDSKLKREFYDYFHKEFQAYYDEGLLNETFYKYLFDAGKFDLFLNLPEKYWKKYLKKQRFIKWKEIKRKFISLRISKEEVRLTIFGKRIVGG